MQITRSCTSIVFSLWQRKINLFSSSFHLNNIVMRKLLKNPCESGLVSTEKNRKILFTIILIMKAFKRVFISQKFIFLINLCLFFRGEIFPFKIFALKFIALLYYCFVRENFHRFVCVLKSCVCSVIVIQ